MTTRRSFIQAIGKTSAILITPKGIVDLFQQQKDALQQENKAILRFAVCSDAHYGQADVDYEFYHNNMIGWLNAEKAERGLDFTCINGDLFHNDPKFLPLSKQKWDQLKMPYYVSHGNHDMVTPEEWEKVWGMPAEYIFEKENCGFIVIDTADSKGNYIPPRDLNWVKEQLARYEDKKHVFVFMHIPMKKLWSPHGIECPEVMALFAKQKNLKAVYHGHDHTLDQRFEHGGKSFFFDAHLGGNWGTPYKGYRMTEVLSNGNILTYQVNPEIKQTVNQHSVL